jgi:hypothetical protein
MLAFVIPLVTVVVIFVVEECLGVKQDPHEL